MQRNTICNISKQAKQRQERTPESPCSLEQRDAAVARSGSGTSQPRRGPSTCKPVERASAGDVISVAIEHNTRTRTGKHNEAEGTANSKTAEYPQFVFENKDIRVCRQGYSFLKAGIFVFENKDIPLPKTGIFDTPSLQNNTKMIKQKKKKTHQHTTETLAYKKTCFLKKSYKAK